MPATIATRRRSRPEIREGLPTCRCPILIAPPCGGGETGKRDALKRHCPYGLVGSSPTRRTPMRRSNAEYAEVTNLIDRGLNDSQIARASGIPRSTVRDWRCGHTTRRRANSRQACLRCGAPEHDFSSLPRQSYAYLLGMYLGDGDVSQYPRTQRLRISLDMRWPGIIASCAEAMKAVFPENRVAHLRPNPQSRCAVVSVYSNQVACLFPQHDAGPKHLRPIELSDWQAELVREEPQQFIRGLIHSDGCRFAIPSRAWISSSDRRAERPARAVEPRRPVLPARSTTPGLQLGPATAPRSCSARPGCRTASPRAQVDPVPPGRRVRRSARRRRCPRA